MPLRNKSVNVVVDSDASLNYEIDSIFKKVINRIVFSILNFLPPFFRKLAKRSHKSTKQVIEHATTHKAIEVLYNFGFPQYSKGFFEKVMHGLWFNFSNSKAVRNRLKLVKKILRNEILRIAQHKGIINFLSIASGSARAIIEVIDDLEIKARMNISFLDKSIQANEYSRYLVEISHEELVKNHEFRWINDTASNFIKYYPTQEIDIVEIVGLFDYFSDDKIVSILKLVYEKLSSGGVLITANINYNLEQKFIKKVIGWDMIYRSADQIAQLVLQAGFSQDKISVIQEPLKIHTVVVAKK
jgi:hypothetical protein